MGKKIIYLLWITIGFAVAASAANRKFVLCIDAGHGGHDTGAPGAVVKEKTLTLRYALAFGAMVERNCPDVQVVYTRKTDRFIELWQRAEIANKAKADLFVSVHINALPKGRFARGYQTYTLGKGRHGTALGTNLDVAKRENSVILMEPNYQQTYQGYDPNSPESDIMFEFIQDKNMERSVELAKLMQRHICSATGRQDMGAHQENLAVLRLTAMPACLMELGFITTPDEEQFMNSDQALNLYTSGFFNAFMAYKKRYNENITVPYEPDNTPVIEVPQIVPPRVEEPAPEVRPVAEVQPVQEPKPEVLQVVPVRESQPEVQTVTQPATQAEVKPVTRPEVTPVARPEARPGADESDDLPVFKVQVTANSAKLKLNSQQFQGLEDVAYYQDGGMYKYTVGSSTDYNAISRLRKQLLDRFPQAFVIAFKNGKRYDVQQAIREFKQNRNKR